MGHESAMAAAVCSAWASLPLASRKRQLDLEPRPPLYHTGPPAGCQVLADDLGCGLRRDQAGPRHPERLATPFLDHERLDVGPVVGNQLLAAGLRPRDEVPARFGLLDPQAWLPGRVLDGDA